MMTTVHNNNNSIFIYFWQYFWAVFVRGAVAGGRDLLSIVCHEHSKTALGLMQ